MASSNAKTVEEYLSQLPEERRETISTLRDLIVNNLPSGFEETMNWRMICYEIPLSVYPKTYNKKPLMNIAIAAQKNYYSLYMMGIYMEDDLTKRLENAFTENNLKMNIGKSCIRFKKLENLPLDAIAQLISEITLQKFIKLYENSRK